MKNFPYFIPPDINGREQEPVVYLYQRLLEQQHEIDELRLKLTLMEKKTGPVFSNPYKAQIMDDDGRSIELGSSPKPVFPPLAAAIKNVEEAIEMLDVVIPPKPVVDPAEGLKITTTALALMEKMMDTASVIEVVQEPLIINQEWRDILYQLDNGTEHIFITGGAGVGKSTLINKWVDETTRVVARLAPTGVAALRIMGQTIHSFFHFAIHALDADDVPYLRDEDVLKLKALDTLLIDEISMVRADLMDAIECTLRKYGPEPGMPFGGVRLVMVGDLYQLPPVVADKAKGKPLESFLMAHYGTSKPFFFHAHCWRERRPKIIELTTIFRQSDPAFVGALNAIRKGTLSTDDLILLNGRTNSGFHPPVGEVWMRIVTTNAKAKEANEIMVQQLPGAERTFSADIRDDFGDDLPTDEYLTLKPGAAVMFIKNDKDHHWVNGTMAKVKEVNPFLLVEVNGIECMITREKWESIEYQYDKATKKLKKTTRGSFSQIPLKIAAAATIHKVQGTTLEHAILDLGTGTFDDGMLYVGLSRLTSLEGLVLARDIRLSDLRTNKEVQRFMTGLEIARPASLMF